MPANELRFQHTGYILVELSSMTFCLRYVYIMCTYSHKDMEPWTIQHAREHQVWYQFSLVGVIHQPASVHSKPTMPPALRWWPAYNIINIRCRQECNWIELNWMMLLSYCVKHVYWYNLQENSQILAPGTSCTLLAWSSLGAALGPFPDTVRVWSPGPLSCGKIILCDLEVKWCPYYPHPKNLHWMVLLQTCLYQDQYLISTNW